jgi:uncharacterized DUF497 family protein
MTTLYAGGFDRDRGNRAKCQKHGLSIKAIENLFTRPVAIFPDADHSQNERRYRAIGRTDTGRGIHCLYLAPHRR